jgi:glutamate-1-semialdehyde 2,1-aminomutase
MKSTRVCSRSEELYQQALKVLPGGNSRTSVYRGPFPYYAASGKGARIVDVDGVERIDFVNNYTSLIHGHAHPAIVRPVIEQILRGTCFAMPTETEVRLAELLCSRIRSLQNVRFMNSGTEAVMMGLKAARGFTGRAMIAKCEGAYHGSYDFAEISQDPTPEQWGNADPPALPYSKGTPRGVMDNVVVIPFNKIAESERILTKHARDLACVIIDPMPNRVGLIPATKEYLIMLRDVTLKHGVLLLFDEVIALRLGFHGAQGIYGIDPDLTTLGKVIGGGFPVGAVAGRADVMAVFDPRNGHPDVPHAGTFNANPVTMVAGKAAMDLLTKDAIARIDALGERARKQLTDAFRIARVPGEVTGMGSLFRLHMSSAAFIDYRSSYPTPAQKKAMNELFEYLLDHGIGITPQGLGSISTVMEESDIDRLSEQTLAGLREISKRGLAAA